MMEISWEAVLRQRALSRQGDGNSDVVKEQCGQRNELKLAGSKSTNEKTAARNPGVSDDGLTLSWGRD